MATKYKLIYFELKGKAETARLLFDLAGQNYEDVRVGFDEWFKKTKADMPFHQVPLLEITDADSQTFRLAQSAAINRYLAGKFNLAGKTDIDKAQCDMIVECLTDLWEMLYPICKYMNGYDGTDPYGKEKVDDATMKKVSDEKKKQLEEALGQNGPVHKSLGYIQNLLEANRNGNGFLVGDSITYADVHLMNFYDWTSYKKMELLDSLPLLKEHNEKMRNHPRIAEHLKKFSNVKTSTFFPNNY